MDAIRDRPCRSPATSRRIGVFGASGYAGAELLRLASGHPAWKVALATADSQAGGRIADLYPSLAAAYPDLAFSAPDAAGADGLDLVFLALPHGASQDLVPELRKRVGVVVDLAADFRLRDPDLYPRWYGSEHRCPDLLAEAVTGIPELFPDDLPGRHADRGRRLLSDRGRVGLGAAGAGRPDRGRRDRGGCRQRGIGRGTGTQTEHPFQHRGRGLHRLRPARPPAHTRDRAGDRRPGDLHPAPGAHEPGDPGHLLRPPGRRADRKRRARSTGRVAPLLPGEPIRGRRRPFAFDQGHLGSNCAHLTARYDPRTGWIVAIAAIDNLTKGAAGQAIQCANLALGWPETAGLPVVGLYP